MAKSDPTQNDFVKALKKLGAADDLPSVAAVADEVGVPTSKAGVPMWQAEPVAFPELKLNTPKQIANARRNGVRMERLVARSGKSKSEVLNILENEGVDPSEYIGRGRRFDGSAASKPSGSSAGKSGGSGSKRGAATGRGSSGRRAAATTSKKTTTAASSGPRRARTRAERQAKAGSSPS